MTGCQHDWELTFRDGPTDTNDWKCKKCGETRTTRGRPCDPPKEDR